MKYTLIALIFVSVAQSAIALEGQSKATEWISASSSEKEEWLSDAINATKSKSSYQFTTAEIRACLNSLLRKPVPASVSLMTLSNATAGCMSIIKNR